MSKMIKVRYKKSIRQGKIMRRKNDADGFGANKKRAKNLINNGSLDAAPPRTH